MLKMMRILLPAMLVPTERVTRRALAKLGGPVAADSPWCTYRSGWRLEGDLLTFEDRTVYTQTEMPASGFTAFKALLKARRDTSNVVVLIEPAVANEPAPR